MNKQTIYALSTVFGKSGVAIIRISGEKAFAAVKKMTDIKTIRPRYAQFCNIYSIDKNLLDKALVLCFKAPHSFTGEDVAELQIHGSMAVIESVLTSLSKIKGFRMAEPGEFSKRAFYNGKMDLTEAEGLADLIDSQTAEQQKQALRQMEGNLKNLYDGWRERLLKILAYLEAYIDFPEEDIPQDTAKKLAKEAQQICQEIKQHIKDGQNGEKLREGFRVVIAGLPNAGKSSLLNAIIKREAVIVSDIAGTTRDAVDVSLNLEGYPVLLTDTAGLRNAKEQIEKQGVEIAKTKMNEADFIIYLFDASTDSVQSFENVKKKYKDKIVFVANKQDLLPIKEQKKLQKDGIILISAKNKQGVEEIKQQIIKRLHQQFNSDSGLLITRARYTEALKDVLANLENFDCQKEIELLAEDVRLSGRSLGKITGKIEVEEILNKIFGNFCIGK